jgi:hypothetical protein
MPRDSHIHRLLSELERQPHVSQRSLSARLGIALGLTNLLLRRVAAKGWVRIVRVRPNRVRYLLTPAGFAQKAVLSRDFLQNAVRFYAEARDRVQLRFDEMLKETHAGRCSTVVFYGAGEVAEVGYICVQRLPVRLIGVVDDERVGGQFFGLPVRSISSLHANNCDGAPFDRLVVMCFGNGDKVRAALEAANVPPDRVFWV